jgi:hypothetical protein
MSRSILLVLTLLILAGGCLFQPDDPYYDITLGGSWDSNDSSSSCGFSSGRTYLSFDDGQKFRLVSRYPDNVTVQEGSYSQHKEEIRIEWDTAKGCWSKQCDISELVYEKCTQVKDSAIINHDGKISFRNSLYTRLQ